MASTSTPDAIHTHLKHLYHTYRHTPHIPSKANFFSPTCMQVCRPMPSYSALNRATIVQYLLESAGFKDVEDYERAQSSSAMTKSITAEATNDEERNMAAAEVETSKGKGYYSIRPLKSNEELEILAEETVAPLGMTPPQLDELRQRESWVGMRVDLWDDESNGRGRLIRVKYWWRKEEVNGEQKWMQCLHDIVSIGERDGG